MKPDYSSLLTPERLRAMEVLWKQSGAWNRNANFLIEATGLNRHSVVLEMGMGTGLVAEALLERTGCSYFGVDKNPGCVQAARIRLEKFSEERFSGAAVLLDDVRSKRWRSGMLEVHPDVVAFFSFLQYFSHDEAGRILGRLLGVSARYAVFDILLSRGDRIDDGGECHRTWWDIDDFHDVLFIAGWRLVQYKVVSLQAQGQSVLVCCAKGTDGEPCLTFPSLARPSSAGSSP